MIASQARKVLVVDDEALIAMLIEDMLSDLGCDVVGPAYRLSEALELAKDSDIDCAILDLNLEGKPTFPVAAVLRERNIPFVFASGYAMNDSDPDFSQVRVLQKPFNAADIADAIDFMAKV
jgi:CheY-like chemotaxis protein